MDRTYDGFYASFDTPTKKMGSLLMGADNIVGNDYTVDFRVEDGRVVAWLLNKFGAEVGYLDVEGSRKLQLAQARDLKIRVLLSYVAYSDEPDPGHYWGEMAVFCYNPMSSGVIDPFIDRVAASLGEGVRPAIDLGSSSVQKLFEDPNWFPSETVPYPKKEKGMAVLKDHQSVSEKMIEQGRANNKGCLAVSWVFIIIVVILIAYGIAHFVGVI